MQDELTILVTEFLANFENVLHDDWAYTRIMLRQDGLLDSEKDTFLKPNVNDESEDWGSRGALLRNYRELKNLIGPTGSRSSR